MFAPRTPEYLEGLIRELIKLPKESLWFEFKKNNYNPEEIGEYISALSNSAALVGKSFAYLIWGINDKSHEIEGTVFSPDAEKKGNEELENWILRQLSPKIDFQFNAMFIEGKKVVILEISRAFRHPVQFSGNEFIRIGSYKKRLKEYPEIERRLWRIFDSLPFEYHKASENITGEKILNLIDYPSYFDLSGIPLPENRDNILKALEADKLICRSETGNWDIYNIGALLFARRLSDFDRLDRKAVRVIQYRGTGRTETIKEQKGGKGYGNGFEGLIGFINGLLPTNEVLEQALRKTVPMYPEVAVRELVANAMIHQDFFIKGSGPMIEIFENRMEISNPGRPLVDIMRFLDNPPISRNEAIASLLRRLGVCEERGSGIDKVVFQTELYQLPAPFFENTDQSTRVTLFAYKPLAKMTKIDKVRACYLRACLKYVTHDYMTNTSLRKRFGIESKNKATATRMIKDALERELILPFDETSAKKFMKYVPFWVREE